MKKMMFNKRYGLEQAVIDRLKWKTRRMIPEKEEPRIKAFQEEYYEASLDWLEGKDLLEAYYLVNHKERLPYKVGEVVAIAQNYASIADYYQDPRHASCAEHYELNVEKSSWYCCVEHPGFRNKLFVAADKMIHHIRITDVKIERLNDITPDECLKEGIYKGQCGSADTHFMDAYYYKGDIQPYCTPRKAFAALIDKVSGKGVWQSNPWVFVYEFELVD